MRVRALLLVVLLFGWAAHAQPTTPLAPLELVDPIGVANAAYQTQRTATVLLSQPTDLAFTVLNNLAGRGVDLRLGCPTSVMAACRALPGKVEVREMNGASPLWILDETSFLVSPFLDRGFKEPRSYLVPAPGAASILLEALDALF